MLNECQERICLSTDILTDIFHYCSRKDLALRVAWTNSHFWHSSKNLPTLHFVHDIEFWPNVVWIQYKERGSLHSGALLFKDLSIPQYFVRFRNVSIHSHRPSHFQHNPSLQSFLESSKHAFVDSKLNIEPIQRSEKIITQTIEVLNTSLLNLYSIRLAGGGVDEFLSTKGVVNCDKLIFTNTRLTSDMTVVFTKWLHWKQGQKNSRRHLIFERCDLLYYMEHDKLILQLKKAFLTATSPVNYLVSFVQCIPIFIRDMEFCLENKQTGERMTMFKYPGRTIRKTTFRIWRRIPVENDNQTQLDAELLSMLSGEFAANDSFDKDFYEF